MKITAFWQKNHILSYIAENIESYSAEIRKADKDSPTLPSTASNKARDSFAETPRVTLRRKCLLRKHGLSSSESLRILTDTLEAKGKAEGVKIFSDGSVPLAEIAKEAERMAYTYLSSGKRKADRTKEQLRKKYLPPAPPVIMKELNEEDIVSYILPHLDEYDRKTDQLFRMSKVVDGERFRTLLNSICESSDNMLSITPDMSSADMVLLLEKISILKMLSDSGTEFLKLIPENPEALDKANKRLNAESINKYANSLGPDKEGKFRQLVRKAVKEFEKNKERSGRS